MRCLWGHLSLLGRGTRGFLIGVFALLISATMAFSQGNTGRILGTVTDQTGGAVVGAAVTVTNVQTGVGRDLVTDNAGQYAAPNLLPGTYTVHASAKGFKTVDRQNILLEVDKDVRVDVQLQPGEITQTVEVTSAVPLIDSTSVTLGGTLSNDTINDLPLNGRNYINLLSLRPGVEQYPGGGAWTQASNGLRVEDQNWIVDGLDNNESNQGQPVLNSPGTAGDSATILPIDAIQEFNVEENPKAEWGWRPGAVVNVGLKSGTNSLHGTAYAFGRTDSWDAKNYYTPTGSPNSPLNFEQWGATAGGPIHKDKIFFFAGFEEQRYAVGNASTITIPTAASGGTAPNLISSIPDAETDLANHGVALNPLSLKLLPLYGSTSTPDGKVFNEFTATNKSDNVLAKIDYNINQHHTLSGTYFLGNDNNVSEDFPFIAQPEWMTTFKIRTMFADGRWTYTPNSNWVNEVRFGFVRYNRPVQPVDHAVPPTQYGINTGVTDPAAFGMPTINVAGLGQLGAFRVWPNLLGPDNNFDFLDQLSYLRGKHSFKFGGEVRYARIYSDAHSEGRGQFSFSGGLAFPGSTAFEDFLAGDPAHGTGIVGNPIRNYRTSSYGAFAQDDWRLTQKVTLNLGLRWEYTNPMSEANNLIAEFVPGSPTGLEQVGHGISSPYDRQKTNFAPRFGVAWDVSGNGTTVVRAGGGLFYDMLPAGVFLDQAPNLQNSHSPGIAKTPTGALLVLPNGSTVQGTGTIATAAFQYPGSALNWSLAGPVLPTSATIACGTGSTTVVGPGGTSLTPSPCAIFSVNRNFLTPRVGIWSLSVQHAFGSNLSLELAYIGNHGDDLSGVLDVNQINPASAAEIACGHCEASVDRPFGAQYPYLSNINQVSNPYISNYDGLQVTLNGRNYHGLQFVAGYTYAHALDDIAFSGLNYTPQNNLNPAGQYGASDFDQRNRFTLTTTYNIPGKKGYGQVLEGWVVNSIVTISGSQPWWAFDTTQDISRTGELMDRWDFFGNPSDFKSSGVAGLPYCTGPAAGTAGASCSQTFANGNINTYSAGQSSTMWSACQAASAKVAAGPDGGLAGSPLNSLSQFGCYVQGNSVMVPPAIGTFGTMGRNIFRDTGFKNWDLSLFKNFVFKERLTVQFRVEAFNVLNHPNFANPFTSINGNGTGGAADPSAPGLFGSSGFVTPDVAATNPILGSGGARDIQLGLKLIF
jgi:hypothetical protein